MKKEDVTLEMVKDSDFGCQNCLWVGIECKHAERFIPKITYDGKNATCEAYVYYD